MRTGRGTPGSMRLFRATVDSPDVQDMIKNLEYSTTDTVRAVLEFVRKDVLYFLKSYTNVQQPPRYQRKFSYDKDLKRFKVPKSDRTGWRPAHPGGWADVSQDLMKKYKTDVVWEGGAWKLIISNSSAHAAYVEAKHGYFVVHGVLEPRGPVAKSIAKALKALGVDWKFTSGGFEMGNATGSAATLNMSPRSGNVPEPTFTEDM